MKMYEQRGHDSDKGDVFGYDEIYRLKQAKFNSPEPTNPETSLFEKSKTINFDKVDNILKILTTEGAETTEINTTIEEANAKLNQYTTFDQWGLGYDQNGNMTQKGTQFFTYDYRNQIVSVTDNSDSSTVNYKYDPLGRRIEKSIGTNTVKFYYSGNQVIEERDGSDQVKRQLIYGDGIDELLIIFNYDGATAIPYYVHTNEIGSTTAITNQDGNIVERVSYDVFGMPTFTDYLTGPQNPTIVNKSVIGNDILFQGRRYDKETNLLYFRARYYDPIMGRFLSVDPMGYEDSMNMYQAFNMNPVNFVDPMGEKIYLIGEEPEKDFYRFLAMFVKIGFKTFTEKKDGEIIADLLTHVTFEKETQGKYKGRLFIKLKYGRGTLTKLREKMMKDRDKDLRAFQKYTGYREKGGFKKWIDTTIQLKNLPKDKPKYYTMTFEELFEELIINDTPILFRTGKTYIKNGEKFSLNDEGYCVEPHQSKSGDIEIVVDPDAKSTVGMRGTLPMNVQTIIAHEFGHAFASMEGYKLGDDIFLEFALLMENLYRMRKGERTIRPEHGGVCIPWNVFDVID